MEYLKVVEKRTDIPKKEYEICYYGNSTDEIIMYRIIQPEIKIKVEELFGDTQTIDLVAEKNSSVQGDITWSTNLPEGTVIINKDSLNFIKHYEGEFKIIATASNAKSEKTVRVYCDEVPTATTYTFTNVSSPVVSWDATSTTITFNGVETSYYKMRPSTTFVTEERQEVTFGINKGTNTPIEINPNFEYVDLGLPDGTLWAKCNLGAQKETEYGGYTCFADTVCYDDPLKKGERSTRIITGSFEWNGNNIEYTVNQEENYFYGFNWVDTPYQTNNLDNQIRTKWLKYVGSTTSSYKDPSAIDEDALKTVLDPQDDIVTKYMGDGWSLPTQNDFVTLNLNTNKIWCDNRNKEFNGVVGLKLVSKVDSSKYIFLPAAGYFNLIESKDKGTVCNYMSSTLSTKFTDGNPTYNYMLLASSDYINFTHSVARSFGISLRGVKKKS